MMERDEIALFVKERDEALLSMDAKKIRQYAHKYGVQCPREDVTVLAAAAKAIGHINSATKEQKEAAESWLLSHGFKPDFA